MKKKALAMLAAMSISCVAQAQTLISMPEPVYPDGQLHTEFGIVHVAIAVSAEGKIVGLSVHKSSGLPPFDKKALAAASGAKFQPAKGEDGKAVAATVVLPIQFGLPPGKTAERLCSKWSGELRDFAQYNPQRPLDELKSVAELKGLLVNGHFSKDNPRSNLKDRTARLPQVWERIVGYCRNEREGRVGEIVADVVNDFKY